jgi:hypothetical protein
MNKAIDLDLQLCSPSFTLRSEPACQHAAEAASLPPSRGATYVPDDTSG